MPWRPQKTPSPKVSRECLPTIFGSSRLTLQHLCCWCGSSLGQSATIIRGSGKSYFGGAYQGQYGRYNQGQFQGRGLTSWQFQGGPQGRQDWHAGWNDRRHPKFKELMKVYLELTNDRLYLAEIIDALGKWQADDWL